MSTGKNIHDQFALRNRIRGCWLGKSIGGTLGLPAEGKMERLSYSFYDPVPIGAPPNDDLELQLVWLHLIETAKDSLTAADCARAWVEHVHYMWDEYGRCRWNLRRGVLPEYSGIFENPFHAGMGSPIRSEIWACLFPGDPDSAASYAAIDASLDHGIEGIGGEVFFAVMQNLVLSGESVVNAIATASNYLPESGETQKALAQVRRDHANNVPVWSCYQSLLDSHQNENFTHAPLNVALTVWALLYGNGDFEQSILLAVNGGYDTDCTAATTGATLGLMIGQEEIPSQWIQPIGEDIYVGPGIQGIRAPKTLSELTDRCIAMIGRLRPKKWEGFATTETQNLPDLAALPATIPLRVALSGQTVPWANGELPVAVKEAGGAEWIWEAPTTDSREIICLARLGARLFIDERLVVECPPHLPYVPATHRSHAGSRVHFEVEAGSHRIRLELNSRSVGQEVSVILAYSNLHLCPWTKTELPNEAVLPFQVSSNPESAAASSSRLPQFQL